MEREEIGLSEIANDIEVYQDQSSGRFVARFVNTKGRTVFEIPSYPSIDFKQGDVMRIPLHVRISEV